MHQRRHDEGGNSKVFARGSEQLVGRVSDFGNGERRVFVVGEVEIGLFRSGERFYAYENVCAHQGGPVCEGVVVGKVEAIVGDDRTISGERFSEERLHIVCPWHGYEYELTTGRCVSDRRLRLRAHEVFRRGENLYVVA